MMKNTEWGAMAYFTNSKYGRGNSEVWVNNNSNYVTGCVGSSVLASSVSNCINAYGSGGENVHGSTTNNISGIYDTSAGSDDLVAGYRKDTLGSSGFSEAPNQYMDVYITDNYRSYASRILGDATGELGPYFNPKDAVAFSSWFEDRADMVDVNWSWFRRGSSALEIKGYSGIFNFARCNGGTSEDFISFRIVLSPSK